MRAALCTHGCVLAVYWHTAASGRPLHAGDDDADDDDATIVATLRRAAMPLTDRTQARATTLTTAW